ncbi:MAG: SDR family oxidoreductase [Hyphomicrobiaceae bacterium]
MQVTPRTALVTGAGRRIGLAIALDLARHGWRVALHYGSSKGEAEAAKAEIEAAGGQAVALAADLGEPEAAAQLVSAAVAAFGPLGCLVNNASLFIEDDITTLDAAVWDRQMAVNLRTPLLLAKEFARQLPDGAKGSIVNIVDQRVLAPTPEFLSYSLTKAGLYAATRMLAQALAPRIRVNGIGPGPVLASVYQSSESFAAEVRGTLLGEAVALTEITAAVRFLLDTPSITGQMIAVDAGQHLAWRKAP